MRRVVWVQYVSVDGIADNPSWTGVFWNDEIAQLQKEQLFRSDALLLGRVTYEAFAKSWPNMTDPEGFADRMNSLPKHVASRTLKEVEWNATVIGRGVADAVSRLKEQPGKDILIYGSANLVNSLIQYDLVDEYRLMVHPILVGRGKHLFRDGASTKTLRLADAKTLSSGVVVLSYQPVR
jgi:dihydrofolate reductase